MNYTPGQLLLLIFFASGLLAACGPFTPEESELRAYISGSYCGEVSEASSYQLSLADSTYELRKISLGPLKKGTHTEFCQGTYRLVFLESEEWQIEFSENLHPRRSTVYNCRDEQIIWSRETGYSGGQEGIILLDLFDNRKLRKSNCAEKLTSE